jgi:hypothetical protein
LTRPPARDGASRPSGDGWSSAVYSASATRAAAASPAPRVNRPFSPSEPRRPQREANGSHTADGWTPAGPRPSRETRATRAAERRTAASVQALEQRKTSERGLPWWAALLVLVVVAAIGGAIDTLGSNQVRGGFNFGIVAASVVAILIVKRSHMFPIVIAPPIVYSGGALFQLYVRSSGLHDKKVILDAAANYLVYGFPAIAAATAATLIIAGIRLITRK